MAARTSSTATGTVDEDLLVDSTLAVGCLSRCREVGTSEDVGDVVFPIIPIMFCRTQKSEVRGAFADQPCVQGARCSSVVECLLMGCRIHPS